MFWYVECQGRGFVEHRVQMLPEHRTLLSACLHSWYNWPVYAVSSNAREQTFDPMAIFGQCIYK